MSDNIRLCPNCQEPIKRIHEVRGECPRCQGALLLSGGRWGAWDFDTVESIEALGDRGDVKENKQ